MFSISKIILWCHKCFIDIIKWISYFINFPDDVVIYISVIRIYGITKASWFLSHEIDCFQFVILKFRFSDIRILDEILIPKMILWICNIKNLCLSCYIKKIDFVISQNQSSNNKWLWMRKSCIFCDITKSIMRFLFCDHKINFCDITNQTWLCDIRKSNLCSSQKDSFVFWY